MRPSLLNPLFASVAALPGIAEKSARLYSKLVGRDDGARVVDLLFHLPSGAVDRRHQVKLRDVAPDSFVTVAVHVDSHRPAPPNRPRAPYLVYASDDTGTLTITYFSARRDQIERLLPVGSRRYVSGTVKFYDGMLQMVHPERVVDPAAFDKMALVDPIYPLTEGLTQNMVRRAIVAALGLVPPLPEWLDSAHLSRAGWPDFAGALARLHRPPDPVDMAPEGIAWSRLAYDELLASQLALALVRAHLRRPARQRGAHTRSLAAPSPLAGEGRGAGSGDYGSAAHSLATPTPQGRGDKPALLARLRAALPFTLTASQEAAIADIGRDLAKPERMLRLLQGDVGAGKTVVALFACTMAIAAGSQAALMAPTEILARQHLKTIAPLAEAAGIKVAILTGRERGRERAALLTGLAQGETDLLVGTHALYSDDVAFADLALAVIDEQHRFGVHQRLALARKGAAVDLLVMTATPIPRTLVLTYFGDMDISELRDKPPGREPIDTRTIPLDRLDEVIAAIGRAVRDGRRVYWVCPLVEDSENTDLAAAEARYAELVARFGHAVDLVHGRQRSADKDAAMARFAAGETRILIATTVIEVGVDVPEATVMVIEHAERFGLAQLHQLRGRIGRGQNASVRSTCILLYRPPLTETARARLRIMRETEDGFRIAEEDLRLRGEGDVLGTRQSGLPGFRIAQPAIHRDLMAAARDDAALVLARDPALASERGEALRVLLYLFERDEAVRLIGAG
ncbi:MAG TPA: ATP-dependent DNA helicase RecG [Xanthobacteraceae bacterium]|jgi:ATP-dependent DNA helicase RecG|nr:ATP-dependent DNA helicase RecG [Xanthobacteraceae bacterium]